AMIDDGRFREDLYHRLAVFPIRLPPLRDRPSDLLPIARALLTRIARDLGRTAPRLTPAAEQRLRASTWRGNVRALANALERAAILADGNIIDEAHLWLDDPPATAPPTASPAGALSSGSPATVTDPATLATPAGPALPPCDSPG